jgi:hypothetical protein
MIWTSKANTIGKTLQEAVAALAEHPFVGKWKVYLSFYVVDMGKTGPDGERPGMHHGSTCNTRCD